MKNPENYHPELTPCGKSECALWNNRLVFISIQQEANSPQKILLFKYFPRGENYPVLLDPILSAQCFFG
jgi:hypothetical protein